MNNEIISKWQKEIKNFRGIKSTYIIEGNIHDVYPFYFGDEKKLGFFYLSRIIHNLFNEEQDEEIYEAVVYDPLFGFSNHLNMNVQNTVKEFKSISDEKNKDILAVNAIEIQSNENGNHEKPAQSKTTLKANPLQDSGKLIRDSEIIRSMLSLSNNTENAKSKVVIVNLASRFVSNPEELSKEETQFFLNLFYASQNATKGNGKDLNSLILIVDKYNDIPAWFYINNPNVRTVNIPNPDRIMREAYIESYYHFSDETNSLERKKQTNKIVDLTDGMKIIELLELNNLSKKQGNCYEHLVESIYTYKYGFKDNKWLQIREKIGADIKEQIRNRVKGQDQAIDKVVKVLKRSVMGLSGMQHSSDSKPRGILFLAGPTGTGKTELVKTITELLFEDERSLIRFDMSEYREENSDQKLFGAPPGYVGYGQGGQLTNAVKNNPFSVLLFDEIEKAHPSIMDKFLQILEDGRMTDGQGNTVYFTETIIFFTSNVGISYEAERNGKKVREYLVQPDEPYDDIMKKVKEAMKIEFKPEVLNRIGENIVVFNYIDGNSSKAITKSKIESINKNILKSLKMNIGVSDAAFQWFFNKCWENDTRMNGGRGIGNVIEEYYLNPLAEFLFDNNCNEGSNIFVDTQDDEITFTVR